MQNFKVLAVTILAIGWILTRTQAAHAQTYAGYWLGVTYPADPESAIYNYFANFTQNGPKIGGTGQTADPKLPFGGVAYLKGTAALNKVKFVETDAQGTFDTDDICYFDIDLVYNPAEESLKGTYKYIQNPGYCEIQGGGKIELYRIVLKSGDHYCQGEPINLVVTGKNIKWYDAPRNGQLLATGNSFNPKIARTTTFYITQTLYNTESPPIPIEVEVVEVGVDVTLATAPSCGKTDGSISLAARGSDDYRYSIDGGSVYQPSPQFTGLASGNYNIKVKDGIGCTASKQTTLASAGTPQAVTAQATPTSCGQDNGTIAVTTSATGMQHSVDGITFQVSPDFQELKAGDYTITSRDAAGCIISNKATVALSEGPRVGGVVATPVSCGGADGKLDVQATGIGLQYALDAGGARTSGNFEALEAGEYELTVTDANNCITRQKVSLPSGCRNTVFIPTGFSPNNDGRNDLLTVHFSASQLIFKTITVYNRWGIALYSRQNAVLKNGDALWDGKYKDAAPGVDMCIVVAEVLFDDGTTHIFRQSVEILR